ncbi:protein PAT1 homolog [Zingiber officinale]|uniref:protein PAT1 homolog n=1 Tax=Zingiber officinale TaxID=94328 RepID=UPI001C4D4699|nr:protein PAT1 homolog [Zingiber officinale]
MATIDRKNGGLVDTGVGEWIGGPGDGVSDTIEFDATRYAFFGNSVLEEVELGGLEDEDSVNDPSFVGIDDDYQYSGLGDILEGERVQAITDIDDLASTFSKMDRGIVEPRRTEVLGGRGSFSRESSLAPEWVQDPGFWQDHHILDADGAQDGKRWSSHPHPLSGYAPDSRPLYRTSSSPQQQQQFKLSEPIQFPISSRTSFPLRGDTSQFHPNPLHQGIISPSSSGLQVPFSPPNPYPFSQLHPEAAHGSHQDGNFTQFGPPGLLINSRQQGHRSERPNILSSNMLADPTQNQRHFHNQRHFDNQIASRLVHQQHGMHQILPPMTRYPHMQAQQFRPSQSPPQTMNKFETMMRPTEFRDQRFRTMYRGGEYFGFAQHPSDIGIQRMDNAWPRFYSKYMTTEELENIVRVQHAATHSNDPYVDDYYHQACLAKKYAGSNLKHHFCPNVTKDLSSRPRSKDEPHPYLQVDALGRLSFSSIRRPRPLLEVEPKSASADNTPDQKSSTKPLEQEPMLAARITIEDGLSLLLDVDDLNRILQFSQLQDDGSQLERKREMLLQEVAASFHLVDPLGQSGQSGVILEDDLVFLRLLSLPKGRKLFSRYLQLLAPGGEITRVIFMAFFRRLRFLFGVMPSDTSAAESTTKLAKTIASCMLLMDLNSLSACLAAVVCSSEQPPLRPLGSSAGDGASIIIKSVLDKATMLLTDQNSASNYSISSRNLWQASFNSFFGLLTKYCHSKFDSVMQPLHMQAPGAAVVGSEIAKAINHEMPVELLRASLPHTNEHQRKLLLDFAQRTIPSNGGSNGH